MNTAPARPRAPRTIVALSAVLAVALGGLVAGAGTARAETDTTADCTVTDGTLTWGFKEDFRSYISGTIANGEWTVGEGATYETPYFGFSGATGTYDPATGAGEIAYPGTVTFTGHGGILNTTVGHPQLEFIDGETARLHLDVSGQTQAGVSVDRDRVHFADIDLAAATIEQGDATVTITDAPLTLAGAGAEAFGTYDSGTGLDPVTIELTTEEGCVVAAEPEEAADDGAPAEASAGPEWLPWVVGGFIALAALAVVVMLLARRGRNPEV